MLSELKAVCVAFMTVFVKQDQRKSTNSNECIYYVSVRFPTGLLRRHLWFSGMTSSWMCLFAGRLAWYRPWKMLVLTCEFLCFLMTMMCFACRFSMQMFSFVIVVLISHGCF